MLSQTYVTEKQLNKIKFFGNLNLKSPASLLAGPLSAIPFSPINWATKIMQVQYFHPYFESRTFHLNNGLEALYFNYLKNGLGNMFDIPQLAISSLIASNLKSYFYHTIIEKSLFERWIIRPENYVLNRENDEPVGELVEGEAGPEDLDP
jgi:hypothetical protein